MYLGKKKDGKPVLTDAAAPIVASQITVSDDPRVDLVNAVLDPSVVLTDGTTVPDTDGGETPFGMIRSWKKKDGRLYVWDGGREISLPAADPSTLTPRGVPEVWGADGMLLVMWIFLAIW